nr:hypothetical protein [Streptomyces sabulosicollis]
MGFDEGLPKGEVARGRVTDVCDPGVEQALDRVARRGVPATDHQDVADVFAMQAKIVGPADEEERLDVSRSVEAVAGQAATCRWQQTRGLVPKR